MMVEITSLDIEHVTIYEVLDSMRAQSRKN